MADFKSAVVEVKLAHDIVDYVMQSGVALKPSGPNKFKGLCPFHSDKTPSFTVDSGFQNYKCWSCGVSGDLLKFVQEFEHLEFFDALKKLAEDKNITLDIKEERSGVDFSQLREAMRTVSNFYVSGYRKLSPEHPARVEIRKRGLSEKKMLYGYAPEGRNGLYLHMREEGFSDEVILLTGACQQYEGKPLTDFWNGRLMFFFTDITGKPLGWSGRKLYENDKRGKYVNSRDGILFDKSAILYNILKAKKKAAEDKEAFVAEGQLDVATFVEVGLENAVAASGTAFTEKQAMILRRLVGEDGRIIFCFDGDKAGRDAAMKVFSKVPLIHEQAYAVSFPDGEDPDDYRQAHGNEAFVAYVRENTTPLVEYALDLTRIEFDLTNDMSKVKYISAAARVLRTLSSNVLRETYTKQVSLETFTGIDVIRTAVQEAKSLISEAAPRDGTSEAEEEILPLAPPASEEELELSELIEKIEHDGVYTAAARIVSLALQAQIPAEELSSANRLLPGPFSSVLHELLELEADTPRIPERFTETDLVLYLINANYFPFAHLMENELSVQQFVYLTEHLDELRTGRRTRAVRAKIASVLQSSPDQGAAFLAKAIAAEEKELAKLNAGSR